MSRGTVLNRVRELGLATYGTGRDKRCRLVNWSQLDSALHPRRRYVMAAGRDSVDFLAAMVAKQQLSAELGVDVVFKPVESVSAKARLLKERHIDCFVAETTEVMGVLTGGEEGDCGLFRIRDFMPTFAPEVAIGFLVRSDSPVVSPRDIRGGMRLAEIARVPKMHGLYLGLLDWAGVSHDQAEFLCFPSFDEVTAALADGGTDVACYVGKPSDLLSWSDKGLRWLDLDPTVSEEDERGAGRLVQSIPRIELQRLRLQDGQQVYGLRWPASLYGRFVLADMDEEIVYRMLSRRLGAGSQGMIGQSIGAFRAALPHMVIPLHVGAVRCLRENGFWNERLEALQAKNIAMLDSLMMEWSRAFAQTSAGGIQPKGSDSNRRALWSEVGGILRGRQVDG